METQNDSFSDHTGEIREMLDLSDVITLSDKIKTLSEQASTLATQLQNESIPEEEKVKIREELKRVFVEGTECSDKRNAVFARSV
jgi:hypothetical protein